ncbi:MAG: C25 family cysteine peptidase [Candidatus Fermentibacteraceae bacterium]
MRATALLAALMMVPVYAGSVEMEVRLPAERITLVEGGGGVMALAPGSVPRGEPGGALLPALPLLYCIPAGASGLEAHFDPLELDTLILPGPPAAARTLYPLGWTGERQGTGASVSRESAFRPEDPVLETATGSMGGYTVASVLLSPAALLRGGRLEVAVRGTLRLSWSDGPSRAETFSRVRTMGEVLRRVVENPEDVDRCAPPRRDPLGPDVEYLVVADGDYAADLQPILDLHSSRGLSTGLLTVQEATGSFPGSDDAERLRNAIIHYRENMGTVFVLLAGDETLVPDRLVYTRCENVPPEYAPTDLYFADLDGTWDANGDGVYGQADDGMDLFDDVLLGRALFDDHATAQAFVDRTVAYQSSPPPGPWSQEALLCSAVLFEEIGYTGAKGADSVAAALPLDWDVTRAYQPLGGDGIDTHIPVLQDGTAWNYYAGHGNDRGIYWSEQPMTMMTAWLADTLRNGERAGIHTSIACHPGDYRDGRCVAERLLQCPTGGAVSVTFNTTYGWEGFWPALGASEKLCIDFTRQVFREKAPSIGAAVSAARALRAAEMHGGYDRTLQSLLAWNAFHDPALQVKGVPPDYQVPPYSLSITSPWPNPSRRDAPVRFSVSFDPRMGSGVSVAVHDIAGRLVWSREMAMPGEVVWDGRRDGSRVPRGVYVVSARRGAAVVSEKVTVLE